MGTECLGPDLYLWTCCHAEQLASLLAPLGYEVVQWHRLMVDYEFAPHLHLELLYIAGQRCQKLLTNTDRNGNALLYLQRQHGQSWASSSSFKQVACAHIPPLVHFELQGVWIGRL